MYHIHRKRQLRKVRRLLISEHQLSLLQLQVKILIHLVKKQSKSHIFSSIESINSILASPSTPSIATRVANTTTLTRNRSSSATNPSGITSPLSPNVNSNYIEQSMSPPASSQSMPNTSTRPPPPPPTAAKNASETNVDTPISVKQKSNL